MARDITIHVHTVIIFPEGLSALIECAGKRVGWRFVEFFTAAIRNVDIRCLT